MSTFNYARAADAANRLINKAGGARQLVKKVQSGDPAKPTITDTPFACVGVEFDVETKEIDGKTVLLGDKKAFVSPALAEEAKPGDRYVVGGATYQIVRVEKLAPNGVVLLWTFLIRK
ncbi:putative structural protein [Rhizobium phage RHph_X3_2]|nr:putative structural protein [Rhizobium phage RHph_X3_2]